MSNQIDSAGESGTKKPGFFERLRLRRINKLEEPDMTQYELKEGKLIRKAPAPQQPMPQQMPGQMQQQYRPMPQQPPQMQPQMLGELPPFPMDEQGYGPEQEIQQPMPPQGYQYPPNYPQQPQAYQGYQNPQMPPQIQQPQQLAPQPRVVEVIITLINGIQYKVPLTESDIQPFIEEIDAAIEGQRMFTLGGRKINARNILMYE